MAGCLLGALSLASIAVLSVLGSIYGWGLTPKSWPVIIGSYVGLILISSATSIIAKAIGDD